MMITPSPRAMIVSDLDGTILGLNGDVPENILGISDISKEIIFSVATARPPHDVLNLGIFPENQISYSICLDGAVIISSEGSNFKTLYESLIPIKKSQHVIENILQEQELKEFFIFTGNKNNYDIYHFFDKSNNDLNELIKFQSNRKVISLHKDRVLGLIKELSIRSISTFSICKHISNYETLIPAGCRTVDYPETRQVTSHTWSDLIPNKTNKAHATKKLREILSFSGPVIACGNGKNDLELIKYANFSYAPCDAIEEVRLNARYVATANSGAKFIDEIVPIIFEEISNLERTL